MKVRRQLRRAGQAGGQGEPCIEARRPGQKPFGIRDRCFLAQGKPAQHVRHEVAFEIKLVFEAIQCLSLAEARAPRFPPNSSGCRCAN